MRDDVTVAFELIQGEIQKVVEELREKGSHTIRGGEYDETEAVIAECKDLEYFLSRLDELKVEWDGKFEGYTKPSIIQKQRKKFKEHSKSPKNLLRISFEDGTIIEESKAKISFVRAIEKMGIENVKALSIKKNGVLLVDTKLSDGQYADAQVQSGKYYIMTHSGTSDKKKMLEQIANRLGISINIETI